MLARKHYTAIILLYSCQAANHPRKGPCTPLLHHFPFAHLYHYFSSSHTHNTPPTTMPPLTPLQRLLLRSQPSTPLTSLLTPLPQPCLYTQSSATTRLFTTTPRTSAGVRKSKSFAPHQTGMKQPSQKSFEVMKKEQMKNIEQMPNDVGLIPGTFIMPTGSRLPSFVTEFGKRFQLEKYRLWLRVKEIFGYVFVFLLSARLLCWFRRLMRGNTVATTWAASTSPPAQTSKPPSSLPSQNPSTKKCTQPSPLETSLPSPTSYAKTFKLHSNNASPLAAPTWVSYGRCTHGHPPLKWLAINTCR
jgi:hypothetical protein